MLNVKVLAWSLGAFGAVTFVLCVLYGLVAPASLHSGPALEIVLPGFVWLTPKGFLIGLAESFVYGVYGGLAFGLIYNATARRWGMSPGQ